MSVLTAWSLPADAVREPDDAARVFEGRYLTITAERWPGHDVYEVLHQHDAAAILATTPDERVVLVRQFRPPVRDTILEVPAGLLDVEGEDALSCAERELAEETGYVARDTEFLGGVFVSPGSSDQYVHLFRTRADWTPVAPPEEGIVVELRPLEEMVAAARAGRVRDAKTALALLLVAGRPPTR